MSRLWATENDSALPPPAPPRLSSAACLLPRGLRNFLSLLRHATDDVLLEQLHGLPAFGRRDRRHDTCALFRQHVLFPAWAARAATIEFCAQEAGRLRAPLEQQQEPEFDLRTNPYARRDYLEQQAAGQAAVDRLSAWVRNEQDVERIVRERSVGVMADACGEEASAVETEWRAWQE